MCEKIPVTVIVTTKNEERNIARCLSSLFAFDQVIVVDSNSHDNTVEIAQSYGAECAAYEWHGAYPKKRQWCLDNLTIGHDWIFFVDADEVVTEELLTEIRSLSDNNHGVLGFFVSGVYVWGHDPIMHGMRNNKLCLFAKNAFEFPVVDDLDIEAMGEIEGHYQPVFKTENMRGKIGQLKSPLLHYAYEDYERWEKRHHKYALWEAKMTAFDRWPEDPVLWRERLKRYLRRSVLRPHIMFIYSYIFKLGFLDGKSGFDFACSRYRYCRQILRYFDDLRR